MVKLTTKDEMKRYRRYHLPGGNNLQSVRLNVVYLNKHNDRLHEQMKFDLAWEHDLFIIEAERSASEEEVQMFNLKRKRKIVDFVDLKTGQEIEIVYKHENHFMIKHYRDNGIIALVVGEKFKCNICKRDYPIRSKKHQIEQICDICYLKGPRRSQKRLCFNCKDKEVIPEALK